MRKLSVKVKSVSIVKKKPYPEIDEIQRSFQVSDRGEICLAIGGDGTFLRATRKFDCPILHIRSGEKESLGFHAEATLLSIGEIIEDLKQGNYWVKKYPKLRLTCRGETYHAVNDVILFRANARSLHFEINYYNDEGNEVQLYPNTVRGDGVIFARQIGSTAYSYFSHGPILFDLDAAIVTPIAANHTYSIVSNKDFHVNIVKSVGFLECDGANLTKLYRGESFTVTKSDRVLKVVRLKRGERFADKLARLRAF